MVKSVEIKPGRYLTNGGKEAYIYSWDKSMSGNECWIGTIEGMGYNTWDKDGKDLSGDSQCDLKEELK